MSNETPLRLFLASPSDLSDERVRIKEIVERYNNRAAQSGHRRFQLVGWENTRGTAMRPQDEINLLVGNAEFMIVLFKESWGSDPGGPFGYTSGTEEELFTGLLELGSNERPLEDIWVAFVKAQDPAPEVVALRDQMKRSHSLLFDSIHGDLDTKLTDRLEDWQHQAGKKTARWVNLQPRSGKDVLGAAKKRKEGEFLIRIGQPIAGLKSLKESVDIGGPREQLTFAKTLGRLGRIDEALVLARAAIETVLNSSIELNSELAGDAFTSEAELLRKQGSYLQAINRLGSILGEIDERATEMWQLKSRIYDQRGLANQKLKRHDDAHTDFNASLRLRQKHGHPAEIAQSLLNLLRLEIGMNHYDLADEYADSIADILRRTSPSDLHANAWTAIASLRLRQGRAKDGIEPAEQALALNEQTSHTSGIAFSLLVLGQCSREIGALDSARAYFIRCIETNKTMRNDRGVEIAQWHIEHLTDPR